MRSAGEPTNETRGASSVLRELVSQYRGHMALLALISFVGALLEAIFLVTVTAVAVSLVAQQDSIGPLLGQTLPLRLALVMGLLVLIIRLALTLLAVRVSARLTARVTTQQRRRLAHSYLGSAWVIQQAEPTGRLQALLTGFVGAASSTVTTLTGAVTALLSLFAFLTTGIIIDPISTLAVLAALSLVGAVLTPIRRAIRRRANLGARAGLDFANAVSELGSLGLEMQTYGVQEQFAGRIDSLSAETVEAQRRVQTVSASVAPIYISLAYLAVLGGVTILTIIGFTNLAVIGAVILLMLRSLSYGQQVAAAAGSLAGNAPYLDLIHQTVHRYESSPASSGTAIPSGLTPLTVKEVTFAYGSERPALEGLSFEIQGGEVIGVIGPSGAGKSTLAQLLLGLREPDVGTILVAGVSLREVNREWWSRRVAFVAQEAQLLTGTVAENIRFFREGLEDDDLRRAATDANVLADIEALPRGFDTHLGERGSQLSGGQRQRLSLARALIGRPELLVLDEPTSALDGGSEALVRDTLAELRGQLTTVIIAHRMSTLDICDRIMVIEDGRMTAFDTPAALHVHSAFYQNALAIAGIT